jgi:beta-glucosidase
LTELLLKLKGEYQLPPIYITENGMASSTPEHDQERISFVSRHFDALASAMEQGVDVQGYFMWSLLDNFEWDSGYAKRFGIVHVDYATQKRTLKDSAHWYREFIKAQRS